MSRVVTVPKCRRTWRTMLLSGAAIPRLASARPDSAYRIGDEAIVLPGPPQDFNITLPGAELTTGQTAEVLTRLPQGHTLYWEITALCAHRSELVEGLLEVPYEITFLGAGDDGNPVIQPAVAVPVLTAAGERRECRQCRQCGGCGGCRRCRRGALARGGAGRGCHLPRDRRHRGSSGMRGGDHRDLLRVPGAGGRPGPVARRDRAVALIGICPGNFRVLCMR